jgi:4-hydroxy-tetrahydrodipicolinate synthase
MKAFSGVITALVSPFNKGQVDYQSLEKLVKDQLSRGIQGFVVNGTTGESPTITSEEIKQIFQTVKRLVPKNFPVIVGTGSNSTAKTIEESRAAEKLGADAVLVVVPYYNKPPQRGLFEHFNQVADKINIPVILYNVPGRTITALEIETIKKLSEHPNIIGIKEASGNVDFAKQIREACGSEFLLLSGDDGTYDDFMLAGGDGVISVASHIIPEIMLAKKASTRLPLINALFVEANPIPVKKALQILGTIQSAELRLPLVELGTKNTENLKSEMKKAGILK